MNRAISHQIKKRKQQQLSLYLSWNEKKLKRSSKSSLLPMESVNYNRHQFSARYSFSDGISIKQTSIKRALFHALMVSSL